MDTALALQLVIQGILLGGLYGLIAMGLSLIFGVMGVINFAHGPMIVLGMYFSYSILTMFGVSPYLSIPIVALILFVLGYLVQLSIVNRILDFPEAMQVVPLVSLGLIIENATLLIWGPNHRTANLAISLKSFNIGSSAVDVARLWACILALAITLAVFAFLKYTDMGKAIRAAADNRTGAVLVGIKVDRINNISFGLGAALTGAAGALMVPLMSVFPYLGHDFTLIAFVVVILGGMGSLPGAMIGGVILGLAESLSALWLPATLKHVVSFGLLVVIMLIRPTGIMGRKI
jgi:branched-chain amino acid transport system permease protein